MDAPIANTPTRSGAGWAALLLIELVVGYEWLASGLAKIANGNFPHGLRAALAGMSGSAPHWYSSFLSSVVEPHAVAFGYAIESAELAVGVVLAGAALLAMRGVRVPVVLRTAALAAGLVLATAFELANGGTFGLRLASDSFGEGVDLETVMMAAQLALLVPCIAALRARRRRA